MTIEVRDAAGNRLAASKTIDGVINQLVELCASYRSIVLRLQEEIEELKDMVEGIGR